MLKFYPLQVSVASENAMQSYNSHVNGTVRLILHRGEKRNKTAFGSALINDIRYGAVCFPTVAVLNQMANANRCLWRFRHASGVSWETPIGANVLGLA